jgi:hypothetical protein
LRNESSEVPVPAQLSGKTLAVLGVLALAVRLLFIGLEPPTRTVGDERTWLAWAYGCPGGVGCPQVAFSPFRTRLIFYPPLYPYFLAGLGEIVADGGERPETEAPAGTPRYGKSTHGFPVSPRSLVAVKLGQAVLGIALALAIAVLGARMFGGRVGTAAGGVAALYPDLIWYAAHFWSETLFLAVLWWGIERLVAADESRPAVAAVAGLLWGLAVLTRETNLYFTPVAALWLGYRRGAIGWRRAALFLAATVLTVAPWTYRNWITLHAFIPVSAAGGQNLFQGNTDIDRDETYRIVEQCGGRVEQYRCAMKMGLEAIRARQPLWIFEKLRDEMPNFWEADSLALIHVKRGAYGDVSVVRAWMAAAVIELPYLLVLAGLVLALGRVPWSRAVVLLLLFLAYYNTLHIVTHGFARYRLPIMPVLFLFAAWRIATPGPWAPLSPRRRALVLACAFVLAACLVPGARTNLVHPAFGGPGERTVAPEGQDAPS